VYSFGIFQRQQQIDKGGGITLICTFLISSRQEDGVWAWRVFLPL
jgi:hypothetical protein